MTHWLLNSVCGRNPSGTDVPVRTAANDDGRGRNHGRVAFVVLRRGIRACCFVRLLVSICRGGRGLCGAGPRILGAACWKSSNGETGIRVLPKYDVESTKTVGLVNAIIQERARPRCDMFWNNEILHTLRLDKHGLVGPVSGGSSGRFSGRVSLAAGTWYGFAARESADRQHANWYRSRIGRTA